MENELLDYTSHFPELREVQAIELEILLKFAEVCRNNGLRFFLDSGTALGAVRHKGFIPWDDDIDVGMPRPDYEKFLSIGSKELGDEYFLQTRETDPNVGFLFAKIRKNNTSFVEWKCRNIKMHQGIYIDIFPYDRLPDENAKDFFQKCNHSNKLFYYKQISSVTQKGKGVKGALKQFSRSAVHVAAKMYPEKKLDEEINEELRKFDDLGFDDGESTCLMFSMWVPMKNSILFPTSEATFEGHTLPVPSDSDKYMTILYGDYMKSPPEEERVGHRPFAVSVNEELWER